MPGQRLFQAGETFQRHRLRIGRQARSSRGRELCEGGLDRIGTSLHRVLTRGLPRLAHDCDLMTVTLRTATDISGPRAGLMCHG